MTTTILALLLVAAPAATAAKTRTTPKGRRAIASAIHLRTAHLTGPTDYPHHTRPLTVRLHWLEQRARVHRFGCRHHIRGRFHCHALVWTRRELAEARAEWERRWQLWLPDKWARVGACETGYGKRPGSWTWDSGQYVSAFGIARRGYRTFAASAFVPDWPYKDKHGRYTSAIPSPWQQFQVALAIWRRYGFSGWGCRGA